MKRKFLKYNPNLISLAKNLRNNSTLSEVFLWNKLKGKQLHGLDFHRQKPIANYIVDFFCPELLLAIEIDGESHDSKHEKDVLRQEDLEAMGIVFLRFSDLEVKKEMDWVLEVISSKAKDIGNRT